MVSASGWSCSPKDQGVLPSEKHVPGTSGADNPANHTVELMPVPQKALLSLNLETAACDCTLLFWKGSFSPNCDGPFYRCGSADPEGSKRSPGLEDS